MMRLVRTVALAVTLPVASLWGLFGGCDNCVVDYFQPALDIYKNGDYYVGADLLYWTHSDCDFGYAVELENLLGVAPAGAVPGAFATRNRIEFVKPTYDPGVRIRVGFRIAECYDQELAYTWVDIKDTDTIQINLANAFQAIEPTLLVNNSYTPGADRLVGEVHSRYQRLEWNINARFAKGDWGYFYAGGIPQWVSICHRRNTTANFPGLGRRLETREKISYDAGGVGYSVGYLWLINPCGLYTKGKVQLNTTISRQRMTRTGVMTISGDQGQPVPVNETTTIPGRTSFSNGFEAAVGVGWVKQCKCFHVDIHVGYEIQQWLSALSFRVGGQRVVPTAREDILFGGIAYGGPSLRVEVGY